MDQLLAGLFQLLALFLESGGHLAFFGVFWFVKRKGTHFDTLMWLLGRVSNILVKSRGHLSLWELAPVLRLGAAEVGFLLGGVLTVHERVNCLTGLVPVLLLGVEDLLDSLRQFLLLTKLLVNLAPGAALEKFFGETQFGLLGATLVRVFGNGGGFV